MYAAVLAFVAAVPASAPPELPNIQGTWKVVSEVEDGQEAPPERNAKVRLVFSADRVVVKESGEAREAAYRLDATKKPWLLEIVPATGKLKGRKLTGICSIDGDSFRICLPTHPDRETPGDFTCPTGSGRILLSLVREK
jgi:uncharacterized protein (TIGR03067 family)